MRGGGVQPGGKVEGREAPHVAAVWQRQRQLRLATRHRRQGRQRGGHGHRQACTPSRLRLHEPLQQVEGRQQRRGVSPGDGEVHQCLRGHGAEVTHGAVRGIRGHRDASARVVQVEAHLEACGEGCEHFVVVTQRLHGRGTW